MAQRRMTSLDVIDTDAFLDMPQSSQLLYFHLNARADDDGFVASPKKIMRAMGSQLDDLKLLASKKFIIVFEDGVCVIKHWRINNFIRKDIYKETKYLDLKKTLFIRQNGAYTLTNDGRSLPLPEGHFKLDDITLTKRQPRLGKVRLGKVSKEIQFSDENSLSLLKVKNKSPRSFANARREKLGKPALKSKLTLKQVDFFKRSELVTYFKEAVNQEHSKNYFSHPSDIKDIKSENSKISKLLKEFFVRCDGDIKKAKAVIDFWASGYGQDFWNYKPQGCFRKDTIVDFENGAKPKIKGKNVGIVKSREEVQND